MSQPQGQTTTSSEAPNSILCLIVNFFFPGLSHIIWLKQQSKGIAFLVWSFATIILCIIPFVGFVLFWIVRLVFTLVAMIDGHYVSEKMVKGQTVAEGEFSPSVSFIIPLCQPLMGNVQGIVL
jgi:TM2 domain-containing membrane protein YozV